jgi:hypothetical protein
MTSKLRSWNWRHTWRRERQHPYLTVERVVIDHETFCKIHDCHDRQGLTIQQTARVVSTSVLRTAARWSAAQCP